jgi:DNA-binding transcriptional ArsR family regulator
VLRHLVKRGAVGRPADRAARSAPVVGFVGILVRAGAACAMGFPLFSRWRHRDHQPPAGTAVSGHRPNSGTPPATEEERPDPARASFRKLKSILLFVDRQPTPSLLPILRSQQQGEILALLLGDPDLELSLTDIAARTGVPHPSVYREIQRAEQAGLVTTRKIGSTRLVRANTTSPYYAGLAQVLTRAFGVPAVLAEALRPVRGIIAAYIYGSWAARHEGQAGQRPVADIDVLILGEPDRDQLYAALGAAEERLGRPVQATIRDPAWLDSGTGAFHDTVTSRPLLELTVARDLAETPRR